MTPELKKYLEVSPLIVLIIFILAGLISILPEIIKEEIETTDILIALGILSVSSFAGACSSYLFTRKIHDLQCQNCVDDLKNNLKMVQGITKLITDKSDLEYEALVSFEKLKEIESSENQEIWVSTSDLGNDVNNLNEIIFKNIENNVKYVYFIPKHDKEDLKSELVKLFNKGVVKCGRSIDKTDKVLEIIEIPSHFFYLEFVIYMQLKEKKVLFLLPQNKKNGDEELYYRVPKDQAKIFIESLSQLRHNLCKDMNIVDIDEYNQV